MRPVPSLLNATLARAPLHRPSYPRRALAYLATGSLPPCPSFARFRLPVAAALVALLVAAL